MSPVQGCHLGQSRAWAAQGCAWLSAALSMEKARQDIEQASLQSVPNSLFVACKTKRYPELSAPGD